MTITRANAEVILIKRIGGLFTDLGLDGTTVDGTNADLNDPIAWALQTLGYGVTDITNVSDTDLSALETSNYNSFFDLAEYRCLQTALSAASYLVTITVGPRSEQLNHIADTLGKMIDRKWKAIQEMYGIGLGTFTTSTLEMDFARHGDDTIYQERL